MYHEMFKQLVDFKLSLAHKAVERLPKSLQEPIKDFESQMMQVLMDISKEYLEKMPVCENHKTEGLKQINIE